MNLLNSESNSPKAKEGNGKEPPVNADDLLADIAATNLRFHHVAARLRVNGYELSNDEIKKKLEQKQRAFIAEMQLSPELVKARAIYALLQAVETINVSGEVKDLPRILKMLFELTGLESAKAGKSSRPLSRLSNEELTKLKNEAAQKVDGMLKSKLKLVS